MVAMHSKWLALAVGVTIALPSAHAIADMYRWVDAKGVVNYSNVPPPANANARRIADAEPAVSVIPLPVRPPEAQREAKEAALARKIERLEDELAELRRAAIQRSAYVSYAAPPMVSYADDSAAIAYPLLVYPSPIRTGKPVHPRFRPGHVKHPVALPHGARRGFSARRGR